MAVSRDRLGTPIRAIGCLMSLVLMVSTGAAQAAALRSSDVHPIDYPAVQAVDYMGRLIFEQSRSKFMIDIAARGVRGSEYSSIVQVRSGTLDMARVNTAQLSNFVPAAIVPALPFLFKSAAQERRVLDGQIGEEILASMEAQGFIGLCFYDAGARSFYSPEKAIRTVADMKGMRVRVQRSNLSSAIMQAMGAEAVPIPYGQTYAALKAGVVDAAENNWPSYESSRHYDAAKIYSLTEHSRSPGVVIFSKKVWDRLSKADQAIVRAAARESVSYMRGLWDEREPSAYNAVQAAGAQIAADVDRKSFSDAMAPVYATFAADPKLHDLVKRIQAAD